MGKTKESQWYKKYNEHFEILQKYPLKKNDLENQLFAFDYMPLWYDKGPHPKQQKMFDEIVESNKQFIKTNNRENQVLPIIRKWKRLVPNKDFPWFAFTRILRSIGNIKKEDNLVPEKKTYNDLINFGIYALRVENYIKEITIDYSDENKKKYQAFQILKKELLPLIGHYLNNYEHLTFNRNFRPRKYDIVEPYFATLYYIAKVKNIDINILILDICECAFGGLKHNGKDQYNSIKLALLRAYKQRKEALFMVYGPIKS